MLSKKLSIFLFGLSDFCWKSSSPRMSSEFPFKEKSERDVETDIGAGVSEDGLLATPLEGGGTSTSAIELPAGESGLNW